MARIRTVKPEILEDEKTAALSDAAYRLFTSMIFLADDHGNVRADPRWLQCQIWWAHREPPRVAEILREVSECGLVTIYEVRGGVYAHLTGWQKHQRIDNAGKPRVPGPNDADAQGFRPDDTITRGNPPRNSANRGETRLDPDQDQDPGPSGKPDPAALLAEVAVTEINRLAGTKYKPTSEAVLRLCKALHRAKRTPAQVRDVISAKRGWIGDPKMGQYFRPATLLAAENFAAYLDDIEAGTVNAGPRVLRISAPDDDEPEMGHLLTAGGVA